MKSFATAAVFTLALASTIQAHCGRDFIVAEDTHLPAPWDGNVLLNFEWEKYDDRDEFGLEAGFMFGVLPRVALGADVGFRDESDGWEYSSVRPRVLIQLTPSGSRLPFRAAINIGYQFANGDAEGAGGHHDSEAEDDAGHGGEHGHENEHEHDHEAEGHEESHHHGGVHNHDEDLLSTRLILEANLTESTRLVFNLICNLPDGGGADWGYAAGVRQVVADSLAVGVEAIGDFESSGYHQIVGAIYADPVRSLTLKLGVGFGLTEASPDFALHAGLNWRF